MGLYDFKPRFVPFIRDGRKRHTIRAKRKNHTDKPGDTCHLYVGLRTKKVKLIGRFPCVKTEKIRISEVMGSRVIWIGDQLLSDSEEETLARADGFSSFHEMMKFWDGRLPFTGEIVHWKYGKEYLAKWR